MKRTLIKLIRQKCEQKTWMHTAQWKFQLSGFQATQFGFYLISNDRKTFFALTCNFLTDDPTFLYFLTFFNGNSLFYMIVSRRRTLRVNEFAIWENVRCIQKKLISGNWKKIFWTMKSSSGQSSPHWNDSHLCQNVSYSQNFFSAILRILKVSQILCQT